MQVTSPSDTPKQSMDITNPGSPAVTTPDIEEPSSMGRTFRLFLILRLSLLSSVVAVTVLGVFVLSLSGTVIVTVAGRLGMQTVDVVDGESFVPLPSHCHRVWISSHGLYLPLAFSIGVDR